jgi:hypothetical protein
MKSWLTFQPASKNPEVVLPQQGSVDNVNSLGNPLPYSVYADDPAFKDGAVEQVNYTFTKLGGRTLDIELSEYDVYTHYQEACIEFANLLNMYHGKDILPYALGTDTGIFDSEGNLLPGSDVAPGTQCIWQNIFAMIHVQKVGEFDTRFLIMGVNIIFRKFNIKSPTAQFCEGVIHLLNGPILKSRIVGIHRIGQRIPQTVHIVHAALLGQHHFRVLRRGLKCQP